MSDQGTFRGRRLLLVSLAVAGLGAALFVLALVIDRRQALISWLIAYAFAVSLALGALIFLMIGHAMSATWPVALRRLTETVAATLPLFAPLFLPLLLGLDLVFPWIHPERFTEPEARHLVEHKLPYLNVPFFLVRAVLYLAVWSAVGWLLRRWSLARDADQAFDTGPRLCAVSAACLPAVGLTLSFASFDWLMSLSPTWSSTMYGVYYFAGGFVGALALLTVLARAAERAGYLVVSPSHYYALGRLLLAFTVFWAYAAFFQFFLIWIADKPVEVTFYAARMGTPFGAVSVALIFAHFVVPFLALLSYRIKRRGGPLAVIAAFIVAVHYLDVHWLVAPTARAGSLPFHWADLGALLAVGGASVAAGTWLLRGRPMVPTHDPALAAALAYESQ